MILVTGSSGRIGRRLVESLLSRGETVRGFDLNPSGRIGGQYTEIVGAFSDAAAARQAMHGVRAVFHLGAFMSWRAEDQARLFDANVEGTRILVAEAAAAKARFIFASSGEVYTENVPAYLPVDEEHPLHPLSAYGVTKLLGEEIVRWAGRSAGLAFTILRFSHTQDASELLDPDSFFSGPRFFLQPRIRQQDGLGNAIVAEILRKVDDGMPAMVLARNENGRPFRMHITDARDMVTGLLLALDTPQTVGEIYNLGATDPVDFAEALPLLADVTGYPIRVVDLPGAGVFYETSNTKFRKATGFRPQWPFARMVEEAAKTWRTKHKS